MDESIKMKSRKRKAKAFYFTQFGIVAPAMFIEAWKAGGVRWPIVVFGLVNLAMFIGAISAEKICLAAIDKGMGKFIPKGGQ
jgi:hypothetical protein